MTIQKEASQWEESPLLLLITVVLEMNESPWWADTKGQKRQGKVAWTISFISGSDKPQAKLKRKSPSLVSNVGAASISIKLMRQRQIRTIFRINSCPWAFFLSLALCFLGAAAGTELGRERKCSFTKEGALTGWAASELPLCSQIPLGSRGTVTELGGQEGELIPNRKEEIKKLGNTAVQWAENSDKVKIRMI